MASTPSLNVESPKWELWKKKNWDLWWRGGAACFVFHSMVGWVVGDVYKGFQQIKHVFPVETFFQYNSFIHVLAVPTSRLSVTWNGKYARTKQRLDRRETRRHTARPKSARWRRVFLLKNLHRRWILKSIKQYLKFLCTVILKIAFKIRHDVEQIANENMKSMLNERRNESNERRNEWDYLLFWRRVLRSSEAWSRDIHVLSTGSMRKTEKIHKTFTDITLYVVFYWF